MDFVAYYLPFAKKPYPLQGSEQLVQAYVDGGSNLVVSKNTGLGYWLLTNNEYANMTMYVIMVFLINED